jgi:hypothetical protein
MRGELPAAGRDVAPRRGGILRHSWAIPVLLAILTVLIIAGWLAVRAVGDVRGLECWPSCSDRQDLLRLLGYTAFPGAIICIVIAIVFAISAQMTNRRSGTAPPAG